MCWLVLSCCRTRARTNQYPRIFQFSDSTQKRHFDFNWVENLFPAALSGRLHCDSARLLMLPSLALLVLVATIKTQRIIFLPGVANKFRRNKNFQILYYKSLMKDSKPPTATHGRYRSLPKGLTSLSFDFFVIIIKINYLRSSSMPKAWLPSSPQGAITIICSCRTELCNPSEKLTPFRQNLCEYIFHNP